ncbi:MAG: CAP domain-containing protein [Actinomycetota bacterium]
MLAPSRAATRRRLTVVIAAALALAFGTIQAPDARAGSGHRGEVLRLINEARARHDLRAVRLDRSLSREATKHSRDMLRQDRLFDPPNLRDILAPYPWNAVGAAAVGCADSLRALHRAFLGSDVHRSILLHRRVRWVGIGVVRASSENSCGRDSFWATEIFYG